MVLHRIVLAVCLAFLTASCAPCRRVSIQSRPSGAAVYLYRPGILSSPGAIEDASAWRLLGRTPLEADSCALRDGLRANWRKMELPLPDYRGQKKIYFDFERGEVTF